MSKKGQTRPWRIAFKWENGLKGTITEPSYDHAELRRDELLGNAEARDMRITVTITNRDDATFEPQVSTNLHAPECTCVLSCADDPATACSLSGQWHVHPDNGLGIFGPCPEHPDAPGDL